MIVSYSMKKEDIDYSSTPENRCSNQVKIIDNIISNDDLAKHQPSYIARSNPESKEAKREISWVNSFFRENSALLKFRPYANYHIAIRAVEAYCGFLSHELKFSEDLEKTSDNLISCCFLLKFLLTIDDYLEQGKEFQKSYSFVFENKLLWSEYRWRLRYHSNMYKFVLQSGSHNNNLHSQIYKLLTEVRSRFPRKRAEDLFVRILRIAESTRLDDGY